MSKKTKQLMDSILDKIEAPTTCQICARPIKASNGRIAHHGYKRPGGGWQTASCIGARHLPYEVSCDQIPVAIAMIQRFLDREEIALALHITFPPETIKYTRGSWEKTKFIANRPPNFNSTGEYPWRHLYSYESLFFHRKDEIEQGLKHAMHDLEFLTKRLADWVPLRKAD